MMLKTFLPIPLALLFLFTFLLCPLNAQGGENFEMLSLLRSKLTSLHDVKQDDEGWVTSDDIKSTRTESLSGLTDNIRKLVKERKQKRSTTNKKYYSSSSSPTPYQSWYLTSFRAFFKKEVLKPDTWYDAHERTEDAIYRALYEKYLPCWKYDLLDDILWDLEDCRLCVPPVSTLPNLKSDKDPDIVLLYKSLVQLIALKPLDCVSTSDYCGSIKSTNATTAPPCTRSYCWFFPGRNCTPRYSSYGYLSTNKVAKCKDASWLKANGYQCPVTNCEPAKRDAPLADKLTSSFGERRKKLFSSVHSLFNNKRAKCPKTLSCGSCENLDTEDGADCQGRDLNGNNMCCMCVLATIDSDDNLMEA